MKTTHETAPSPEVGWSSRRVTYSKQMLEALSEIKKQNGGRVSNTVQVYHDLHLHTLGDITIFDLIRFAEDCDKILAEIETGGQVESKTTIAFSNTKKLWGDLLHHVDCREKK